MAFSRRSGSGAKSLIISPYIASPEIADVYERIPRPFLQRPDLPEARLQFLLEQGGIDLIGTGQRLPIDISQLGQVLFVEIRETAALPLTPA